MTGRLAILSGTGTLPGILTAACPGALRISLVSTEASEQPWSPNQLGALVAHLRAEGITEIVFAGALHRGALCLERMDRLTRVWVSGPDTGDDCLLRRIAAGFEAEGFVLRGASDLLPGLTAAPGLLCGAAPDAGALGDVDRAASILAALDPFDVGQGCVVAGGRCLGIEAAPGTDALLRAVAALPDRPQIRSGILLKRPKRGQDLRLDMPAIGPETVTQAVLAGLAGIVITPGDVLILERAETLARAQEAGLFVLAKAL